MKTCPNCGTENKNEALFCVKCGTALEQNNGSRKRFRIILSIPAVIIIASALITGGYFYYRSTVKSPARQKIETKVTEDTELFQAKKYGAIYENLAGDDQKEVTKEEWVKRSKQVESTAGKIESFEIVGTKYLTADKSVLMTELEIKFSKFKNPIKTAVFYIREDGHYKQTMMWGKRIKPKPTELR